MNTKASLGFGSMTLLLSCALISASLLPFFGDQIQDEPYNELLEYDEEDINALLNNTVTDLTTFLQIKNSYAAFSSITKSAQIEKIAIYIKPFHDTPLYLDTMTLTLETKQDIYFLQPTQLVTESAQSLFNNQLWNHTPPGYYSIVSLNDRDSSLKNHLLINSNTDTFYLLLTVPQNICLSKGDQLSLMLLPAQGQLSRIDLEVPLPINQVVRLLKS